MAFQEFRLLDRVAMGAQGGPTFSTALVAVRSGRESRNGNWVQARHSYDIGLVARPLSEFEVIKAAFLVVGGRRDGFRWKDHADYLVTSAQGAPQSIQGGQQTGVAGFGYGLPGYQLRKLYLAGSGSYLRDILKPVAGSLIVRRAGSPVTAGVAPGNYAVDTTGVITFVADQTRAISSHTPGAGHVFTLASAFSPNLAIGGRIYVSGITGTAATALNGLSHAVTNVAAAVITTSTVTTGLTASGGNAFYYPQPSESLDFASEFDVPVRFDVDHFDALIRDRQGSEGELLLELPSIPLVEIRGDE